MTTVIYRTMSDHVFVTFHDAGWAVRKDGKPQDGFIWAMAERAILTEGRSPTSPISMVSKKCPRVARSSLGCEVQSGNMADEETTFLRLGVPGNDEWWKSAGQHQGGAGSEDGMSRDRLKGPVRLSGDQCECWLRCGQPTERHRVTVPASKHGLQSHSVS